MKLLDPDKSYSLPQPESETEALVFQLEHAAANWFKTKNPEYVEQYHAIYDALRAHGWDDAIDLETLLPDHLMPQDYLNQVARAKSHHARKMS
jgi:hypothetical protein